MSDSKATVQYKLNHRNTWCLLGLPFDAINLVGAVAVLNTSVANNQRLLLSTPNLNFLVTAQSEQKFYQSVADSDLVVADGMPIIWIARLLGIPLTERVAGSDLFDSLSKQHGLKNKISVFFFGGQEDIAQQACQKLKEHSPAMTCCGFYDPGFVSVEAMSTPAIIDTINARHPDFLLLALGAEKGQAWMQKNRHHLNATVISHLGAVVNFVAENIERAPVFWQRSGFEWLWRIVQEPALWRRYFFDGLVFARWLVFKVLPLAIYDRCLKHMRLFQTPLVISYEKSDGNQIKLAGSIHYAVLGKVKHLFFDILQECPGTISIDCSELIYIDAAFIGLLMLFQSDLNEQNQQLYLQDVPKRISRVLKLNNALNRFQFTGTNKPWL